MKKSLKISLGIFGILSIGAVSLASVISCSSKSNNDAKSSNSSSSTSSSSSSSNLSYIPYSDLTTTVIKNGDSDSAWTYTTALASWQKIFASYNYKAAVESALNSYFYDWNNWATPLINEEYQASLDNSAGYTSSPYKVEYYLTISNFKFSWIDENYLNISYTINNEFYVTYQNQSKSLGGYSYKITLENVKFGAGIDTNEYWPNESNQNYGQVEVISASAYTNDKIVNSSNWMTSEYDTAESLWENYNKLTWNKSSEQTIYNNYSYQLSSTSQQYLLSFPSTYKNGVNYGTFPSTD